MKVLITVPRLGLAGGVANYYSVLRQHLDADKEYLEIGSLGDESGSIGKLFRLMNDWWRFHRALSRGKYDLVHVNPSLGSRAVLRDGVMLMIASWHGIRSIVFFRGWNPQFEDKLKASYLGLFRRAYGRASAFILLGSIFEKKIRDMGFRQPVFLATTLVDDSILELEARSRRVTPAANILILSRLDHGKGITESIHAFQRLQQQFPEVSLTVAGDGPIRSAAEQLVKNLGLRKVVFLGHVTGNQKNEAFRSADIYLFASLHEGLPNSVLEAMAYGLPVVTSAVGGLIDLFVDEKMGCIVDPRSPDDIHTGLARLIGDPDACARISTDNREFARRKFAASLVAARLQDVYADVYGRSRTE